MCSCVSITLSVFKFAEVLNKREENVVAEPPIAEADISDYRTVEKYPEHTMPGH
jgi:hypothetical protein